MLPVVGLHALATEPFDDPIAMEKEASLDAGAVDPTLPYQAAGFLDGETEQVGHPGHVEDRWEEPGVGAGIRSVDQAVAPSA